MSGAGTLPISANARLGPVFCDLVAKAACGDLESQRCLFQDRLAVIMNPATASAPAMLISMEAVLLGRLIASHGHAVDARWLAGALCQAATVCEHGGHPDLGEMFMAETVGLLEQLAECGDDLAALSSEVLIRDRPPAFFDRVRAIRAASLHDEGTE